MTNQQQINGTTPGQRARGCRSCCCGLCPPPQNHLVGLCGLQGWQAGCAALGQLGGQGGVAPQLGAGALAQQHAAQVTLRGRPRQQVTRAAGQVSGPIQFATIQALHSVCSPNWFVATIQALHWAKKTTQRLTDSRPSTGAYLGRGHQQQVAGRSLELCGCGPGLGSGWVALQHGSAVGLRAGTRAGIDAARAAERERECALRMAPRTCGTSATPRVASPPCVVGGTSVSAQRPRASKFMARPRTKRGPDR